MPTDYEIGTKLARFRKEARLTQYQLAEDLDISHQQLQRYEGGITSIPVKRLLKMADVLKIPVELFFAENQKVKPYRVVEEEPKLIKSKTIYSGMEKNLTPNEVDAFLFSLIRRLRSSKIKQGLLDQLRAIVDLESHSNI